MSQSIIPTLPETAIVNANCFSDKDFFFKHEAKAAENILEAILNSFSDQPSVNGDYVNNIIGIVGERGTGKSTLITSIFETIHSGNSRVSDRIICAEGPIDPKTMPANIGIVGLVLAKMYDLFCQRYLSDEQSKGSAIGVELMQSFVELNNLISLLLSNQERNAYDNPSDLYQVTQITTIRRKLKSLAQRLCEYFDVPNGSILIAIDDFDLDSKHCYRMASDAITYLSIPHLTVLVALDENIFRREILRGRISELSDYGPATSRLLDSDRVEGGSILQDIYGSAKKYTAQLSDKFIPLSRRVYMHSGSTVDPDSSDILLRCSDWLFGEGQAFPDAQPIYQHILFQLLLCDDMRTRNQALNQLDELTRVNDDPSKPLSIGDSKRLAQIFDYLDGATRGKALQIGEQPEKNDTIFKVIADSLKNYGVFSFHRKGSSLKMASEPGDMLLNSKQGAIYFSDIGRTFLRRHPLGRISYEYYVEQLNPESPDFAESFCNFVNYFSEGYAKIEQDVEGNTTINLGDKTFTPNELVEGFKATDNYAILALIGSIKNSRTRIKKEDVRQLLDALNTYFETSATPSFAVERYLKNLNAQLDEPWGTAQDRTSRKREISQILSYLERIIASEQKYPDRRHP